MAMSTVELPSTNDAVVETDTITKDSTVVQKGKDSTVVQKGKDSTVVQKGKDNADVSNGEKYSAAVPDSTDSVDIPFDMVKKDGMRFVESKETFITQSSTLHTEKSNCSTVETDLRKPLGFCNWIVSHYKAAFGLTLSCHMVALFVTGVLIARGLFPISREELHLTIRENDDYLRGLAWMHRHEDKSIIRQGRTNEAVQLERSMSVEPLQLFFELAGGNVLTKAALTDMRRVEDKFYTNAVYQKSFCWLVQSGCVKPMSILRYFDGTYATLDPVFYDPDFANISGVISTADQHPETRRSLRHCLGTGAVINMAAAVANITRAMLYLGLPLSGYHNDSDRVSEQKAKVKTFFKNALMPLGNEYFAAGVGDMTFFYGSSVTVVLGIRQTSLRDLWLVAGAYVFIFVYLWWQTSSLWLASFVMLTTASGYCGSYLVYRVVFGYSYFGVLHELTIFIMLAMNADDVFVFHNAWRLAEAHASLVRRLSTSYRQAAPAMFFASLTKIVAFSVGAASPLFSVSTFGLFSAILVVINYLTAITFVPCALVLYHIHLRRCVCCCCCPQEGDAPTRCMQSTHFVVRFFRGPYFRLITHPCARWVILAAFAVIIAAATYTMALMRMNDGPVKMIPDHTNTGRYLLARRTAFEGRSVHDTIAVYMVWGMKKTDMTNCHPSNVNCIGLTKWDTSFSLESEDVQLALLHFCKRLKSLSENDITQLYIRRDKTTNEPEVTCFIDEMDKFFMKEGNRKSNTGDRVYPQNASFGIPLEDHDAHVIMASHSNVYRPEDTSGLLTGYFEVMMSFWLYNGFRCGQRNDAFREFTPLLGEAVLRMFSRTVNVSCAGRAIKYTYGTALRFVAIKVNLTLWRTEVGFPTGLPIRDKWEMFFKTEMQKMPPVLRHGFDVAIGRETTTSKEFNLWHFYLVQQSVTRSALLGCIIGLALALPIIVIATYNVYVGLLATLTLVFVTVSVVAVIPLAGWKLGVLEAVNLILVVGLAVNYIEHLAQAYAYGSYDGRLERTQNALEQVGVSVLSGAGTTVGASAFILFCDFVVFRKFGFILFATFGFSFIYAIGFFMTVLGMIGPEGHAGSIKSFRDFFTCIGLKGKKSTSHKLSDTSVKQKRIVPLSARRRVLHQSYSDMTVSSSVITLQRYCKSQLSSRTDSLTDLNVSVCRQAYVANAKAKLARKNRSIKRL